MRPSSEEARRYDQLTIDCMSDESSESENEDMTVHRPVWRSRSEHFIFLNCSW